MAAALRVVDLRAGAFLAVDLRAAVVFLAAFFAGDLRAVDFLAGDFFAAVFRAPVVFLAVDFFAAVVFFAADLRADVVFFAAVFLAAVLRAVVFFAAVLRAAVTFFAAFFAGDFLAVVRFAGDLFVGAVITLPPRHENESSIRSCKWTMLCGSPSTRHAAFLSRADDCTRTYANDVRPMDSEYSFVFLAKLAKISRATLLQPARDRRQDMRRNR